MNFKEAREAAGLTLAQVAELSGYSIGSINGQELHNNGSARLKHKLVEIYNKCGLALPDVSYDAFRESSPRYGSGPDIGAMLDEMEANFNDSMKRLRKTIATGGTPVNSSGAGKGKRRSTASVAVSSLRAESDQK